VRPEQHGSIPVLYVALALYHSKISLCLVEIRYLLNNFAQHRRFSVITRKPSTRSTLRLAFHSRCSMEWIRALLTNNSHWHLWVECLCLSCRLPRFCRITGAFHCLTRYRSGSFCQHTSSPMLCSLSACFERDTSLLHSRADTSLSLCQSSKCSAVQRLIP